MPIQDIILLLLLGICGITDIRHKRIPNVATIPAIFLGLILNIFLGHVGIKGSLVGFVFGFGVFYVLFLIGGMGGGDVKLVAAIGALKGWPFIYNAVLYSAVIGGVMAISFTIWKGRTRRTLGNMWRLIYTMLHPALKTEKPDESTSDTIPYGVAIILGSLWTLVATWRGWL